MIVVTASTIITYDLVLFPILSNSLDDPFVLCADFKKNKRAATEKALTITANDSSVDSAPSFCMKGSSIRVAIAAPPKSTKYSLLISLGIEVYISAIVIPAKKNGIDEAR